MTADERTPLIADDVGNGSSTAHTDVSAAEPRKSITSRLWSAFSVENRILFAGFLITMAFTFTQVP